MTIAYDSDDLPSGLPDVWGEIIKHARARETTMEHGLNGHARAIRHRTPETQAYMKAWRAKHPGYMKAWRMRANAIP